MGTAFRQPKQKQDFYSLFDGWILKDNKPSVENQHYVMAVLVRGGIFWCKRKRIMKFYQEITLIPKRISLLIRCGAHSTPSCILPLLSKKR